MVFKCQEDSFLKEFSGKVISCEPATLSWTSEGGQKQLDGFNVILDETILFPEGGGQPCDYGTLNELPVRSVIRKGNEAVHFVECSQPLAVGDEVKQVVNWERRLDHMQQHSGQHLITALFDSEFKYDTTSWWLGTDTSYIELHTKDVTKQQLEIVERTANALIVEGRKVAVTLTSVQNGLNFQDARAPRGLPADHVGLVRIISIEGIESNMCCGTHVTNISQLQAVKLLHAEKSKGKVYVHFVVGNRVIRKFGEIYGRELQINLTLKGGPSTHLDLIQKLQNNLKITQKCFQKVLKDVATFEAERLKACEKRPKYFSLHRKDGIEPDFINTLLRIAPQDVFYFLTVSENVPNSGKGHMVLRGDPELVDKFGPIFLELLDGKGNGKGNTFQAKVNNVSKLNECEAILLKHFA